MSLDFGLVVLSEHPADRDPLDCADELVQDARLIESLGFDSVWVGEHHFTDQLYFDNFQLLPYLAAETDDLRLGTSVCLVPLHHPVQLAERLATLDVLSEGRLVFGGGVGYRQEEFDVTGVPKRERGRRTTEALELLDRLWTEDDVTYEGEIFEFESVSINPKPVQAGGPDVWIGGSAPPAIRRAARLGDGWFIDPRTPLDELVDLREEYEDALEGEPTERPIWREVFVAETDERARELAMPTLSEKYDTYQNWGGGHAMGDADDAFEEFISGRFAIGSPATVIEELEPYRDELDVDHLVMRHRWRGMDADVARDSLELFADEVMPAF